MPVHGVSRLPQEPDYGKYVGTGKATKGRYQAFKSDVQVHWNRFKGLFKTFTLMNDKKIVSELNTKVDRLSKDVKRLLGESKGQDPDKQGLTTVVKANVLRDLKEIQKTCDLFNERKLKVQGLDALQSNLTELTQVVGKSDIVEADTYTSQREEFEQFLQQKLLANKDLKLNKKDQQAVNKFLEKGFSETRYFHADKSGQKVIEIALRTPLEPKEVAWIHNTVQQLTEASKELAKRDQQQIVGNAYQAIDQMSKAKDQDELEQLQKSCYTQFDNLSLNIDSFPATDQQHLRDIPKAIQEAFERRQAELLGKLIPKVSTTFILDLDKSIRKLALKAYFDPQMQKTLSQGMLGGKLTWESVGSESEDRAALGKADRNGIVDEQGRHLMTLNNARAIVDIVGKGLVQLGLATKATGKGKETAPLVFNKEGTQEERGLKDLYLKALEQCNTLAKSIGYQEIEILTPSIEAFREQVALDSDKTAILRPLMRLQELLKKGPTGGQDWRQEARQLFGKIHNKMVPYFTITDDGFQPVDKKDKKLVELYQTVFNNAVNCRIMVMGVIP